MITVTIEGEEIEMTKAEALTLLGSAEVVEQATSAGTMTVGTLWSRLTDNEFDALDEAMQAEHRRLRGLWNTPSHTMVEGDALWIVIFTGTEQKPAHLDAIVSSERKAELMAT